MHFFPVDNGLNPVWNEEYNFHVYNPEFAMLRFEVKDVDMFGEAHFLGQATFQVSKFRFTDISSNIRGTNHRLIIDFVLIRLSRCGRVIVASP